MNRGSSTRMTNQRLKILEYLRSVKTHPSAEMVFEAVKRDLPAISLATVYRNLNLLAKQGKILRLEIGGEFRFDGDTCRHQHAVCTGCGRVIDIFQPEISDYAMKKVEVRGFRPECVHVIFRGTCSRCSR